MTPFACPRASDELAEAVGRELAELDLQPGDGSMARLSHARRPHVASRLPIATAKQMSLGRDKGGRAVELSAEGWR